MGYELAIADRLYSSWSLRGWLLFDRFGLPVTTRFAPMRTPDFARVLADFAPARTCPALRDGDLVATDSLAIAETLAERHPEIAFWPSRPADRALARSLAAEMHSGFTALRSACPMNLWHVSTGLHPTPEVQADVARIVALWDLALSRSGGPWLFGDYSVADVFFAPVAGRVAGYGLEVPAAAADYVARHLHDMSFRRWRAMGLAENRVLGHYRTYPPLAPWPGPAPLAARPVEGVSPVNAACPYSGKPVAADSLAEIAGRVIGFCNPFCRDKSVADAAAWPKLAPLLEVAAAQA